MKKEAQALFVSTVEDGQTDWIAFPWMPEYQFVTEQIYQTPKKKQWIFKLGNNQNIQSW